MIPPTTQVYIFNTSDSFRAYPGILERAFKQLRAAGVNASLYSGLGFIVANWDTCEQHQEIVKAQFYAELAKGLAPAIVGSSKAYHAQLSGPAIALDKPVTEVALLTLKSPENHAAVVEILSKISNTTENLLAFGQTQEDRNKYIGVYGWDSVEAHKQAALKPGSQEIISKLSSLVDQEYFYYAKLRKFGRARSWLHPFVCY